MNNSAFPRMSHVFNKISRFVFCIFCLNVCNSSFAQHPVGIFENSVDIGNPKLTGSASYDEASQTYSLSGAGSNIWFNRDEFHFVYKKLKGDFTLTADFAFTGDTVGAVGHRVKAAVLVHRVEAAVLVLLDAGSRLLCWTQGQGCCVGAQGQGCCVGAQGRGCCAGRRVKAVLCWCTGSRREAVPRGYCAKSRELRTCESSVDCSSRAEGGPCLPLARTGQRYCLPDPRAARSGEQSAGAGLGGSAGQLVLPPKTPGGLGKLRDVSSDMALLP